MHYGILTCTRHLWTDNRVTPWMTSGAYSWVYCPVKELIKFSGVTFQSLALNPMTSLSSHQNKGRLRLYNEYVLKYNRRWSSLLNFCSIASRGGEAITGDTPHDLCVSTETVLLRCHNGTPRCYKPCLKRRITFWGMANQLCLGNSKYIAQVPICSGAVIHTEL